MVKPKNYVPEKGDIVWLDFDPKAGHAQKGRRPALVISQMSYNEKVGSGIVCPITSKEKGYPFEVKVEGKNISGCVLSDQVKSLDWKIRNVEFIEKASAEVIEKVVEIIKVIIE
jgi:mRNA interferase MazF